MGCCASQPLTKDGDAPPTSVASTYTTAAAPLQTLRADSRMAYPVQAYPGGAQVEVTAALWRANKAFKDYSVVKVSATDVFVALFEGIGSDGDVVAKFCKENAYQVLVDNLKKPHRHVSDVLQATLKVLDGRLLADAALPGKAKALSGAAAALVYVDLQSHKYYSVNLGDAKCVAGCITGSFNSQQADAIILSKAHMVKQQDVEEKVPEKEDSEEEEEELDGAAMVRHFSPVTRALGIGVLKDQALAASYGGGRLANWDGPYISTFSDVTTRELGELQDCIILASRDFWSLVSAQDAVLWAYEFKQACEELRHAGRGGGDPFSPAAVEAVEASRAAGPGSQHTPIDQRNQPNVADQLVRFAVAKVADETRRKYGMKQSLTVEDIRGVRLELPAETGKENSSRAANRNNSAAHPSPSPELTPAKAAKGRRLLRQLTRRELHGDLNVVAVSFAWPPSSTRKAKASTLTSTSPRALRLWGYVRMVANFHRLRRKQIHQRWWALAEQVWVAGQQRARQLEEHIWRCHRVVVQVTPALRLFDELGYEITGPDARRLLTLK